MSIIALLPTLPIPLRLNCADVSLNPNAYHSGLHTPHPARGLAAGTISPLSPTIRIRCFGVLFDSNLCTRPVRSTLWAPICGRPSTTPWALGVPLLVHNLCGRPILYLVGHKRPPSLIIGAPLPNPAATAVRRWLPCTFVLCSDRHGEE